jgi:hypothetical protein
LYLEDDIEVCDKFLESTQAWLAAHADDSCPVYPLGANYETLTRLWIEGYTAWEYPIEDFYGTLAVAMRPSVASRLSQYLDKYRDIAQYDLLIGQWAKEQGMTHFRTPVPSLVQHIGLESIIRPGSQSIVYPCFAGRDWSYDPNTVPFGAWTR